MKLKNIYLSILTFAALTACTSEEIIIDKPGPNAQAVPSVLVLGADMSGTPVETEDDGSEVKKDKGTGLLYALVFSAEGDDEGQLLGAARSASGEKNKETMDEVIAKINESNVFVDFDNPGQISGKDLTFDENEVVVTGLSIKESKKVTVVLVANPREDTRGNSDKRVETLEAIIAGTSKPSFTQYSEEMWASHFQDQLVSRSKDRTDYSKLTASQCFSMTLNRGINYVGTKNDSYDGEKWFSRKNIEIPLYRLVADINLTIKNEIKSKTTGVDGGTFHVTSISPGKYYYSSCVPENVVNLDGITDSYKSYKNEDSYYDYWCKKITKGALPPEGYPWYKEINETISNGNEISTAYCTFEAGVLELKIKGTYQKGSLEVKDVEYIYTFNEDAIRRNKIYDLTLKLTEEPKTDGELIPLGEGLMLEIANMAKFDDYNVTFGK